MTSSPTERYFLRDAICLSPQYSTTRLLMPLAQNSEPPAAACEIRGGLRCQGYRKVSFPAERKPLVTIITSVRNGGKHLEESIQSVLNQSYDNIEYILVDGGSTDSTLQILRAHESQIDLWISEPDKGIYDAWNKALSHAHGDWIAFIGSDDVFYGAAVSSYVDFLRGQPPGLEFVSSRVELIRDNQVERVVGAPWNWRTFASYMKIAHPGAMHSRALFERLGCFDAAYKVSGDYELLLRARDRLAAAYLPAVTLRMRVGGNSEFNPKEGAETLRAKVVSGGRNRWLCYWELRLAAAKKHFRHMYRRWRSRQSGLPRST